MFVKVYIEGEVRGSNPTDSHIQFYITNINQPTGDTWRPCIGPRALIPFVVNKTRVSPQFASSQPITVCHVIIDTSSYGRYDPATSPYGLYGLYGQVQSASKNFACLAWRTDRDNSSIRTPFAKVNILPESGRRDGRNGTVFVAFRAL
jgi:hypothetical protein